MFKALAVVRNLKSLEERLEFGEFIIHRIGHRFDEFRKLFRSGDINRDDWIFEKSYVVPPPGPPGSATVGIPEDVEDVLLALRLYEPGDILFTKLAIIRPDGHPLTQFPYGAVNDINSYSSLRSNYDSSKCAAWGAFADGVRRAAAWRSAWFAVARRYFLSGGAKQWNPRWGDVDRVVDYATALESALVPEGDFSRRRVSQRSAALIEPLDPSRKTVVQLIGKLYDIRSQIVHGSALGNDVRDWLAEEWERVESVIRRVLVAAIQSLPSDPERQTILAGLYDPTDQDRADFVLQKFKEIKDKGVRTATFAKIRELI